MHAPDADGHAQSGVGERGGPGAVMGNPKAGGARGVEPHGSELGSPAVGRGTARP